MCGSGPTSNRTQALKALGHREITTMFAFGQAMTLRKPQGGRIVLLATSALSGRTLRGLAIATGLAAVAPMLAPPQAAAQFVCGGSPDGNGKETGGGATATPGGVACG